MTRRHLTVRDPAPCSGLALAGCGGNDNEGSATTAATTEASTTGGESAPAGGTTLNGSVGPGFDISLDGTDGLTAGTTRSS